MRIRIWTVDAFTDKAFGGNPAAVCILPKQTDDRYLQSLASEMNLSETAFLLKREDGFGLRWFTPTTEVDLCGHATLASSHILWQEGILQNEDPARFHTLSGLLLARRKQDGIELDFPVHPVTEVQPPQELKQALGVNPRFCGRTAKDFLVEVDSEETLRKLQPDIALLSKVDIEGVIVTSRSATKAFDFISRYFAPSCGIPEDPVTGMAHCGLTPYWSARLHKTEMNAYQASTRGGVLHVQLAGDRVLISGKAVTVVSGELDSRHIGPED